MQPFKHNTMHDRIEIAIELPPPGGGGSGGGSLYFVWYRRTAGIAPFFQVIYTSIGHDFFSNIQL